jgi:GntR family carbon starvation induced transcriptional regulator
MQDHEQSTKTESAYRLLRRDILSTRLKPGAPMKLSTLRESYGIGWTPLREALSRLEAEGLVTAISNRGFAVAPVSREELDDLTRARLAVEMPLLIESIENGDSAWESAVVTAHYRLSRC